MFWTPKNSFQASITNLASTPSTTPGTSLTPANNSKPAYTQLLTATAFDTFFIEVWFATGAVAAAARDMIADIGVDPAGGTTYAVLLPDLMASCASDWTGVGHRYFFPVYIKSGSTVAARVSINNATVGTVRCVIRLWGRPSNPAAIKYGTGVLAYGITAASSRGTLVTPGATGTEGTYVSLGTTTADHWWWQTGYGCNDTTMTDRAYHGDLAIGNTSETMIIENDWVGMTGAEEINHVNAADGQHYVKSGRTIYGRMTSSGTAPDNNYSMAAYGVYS